MRQRECESIRPLISALMDGELSPDEGRILHAHLASCDACREIFDEYCTLRDEFRQLPPAPPPPDEIADYVWQHTVKGTPPSRFQRWFGMSGTRFGLSTVTAVAVLIIALAFLLVQGYQRSTAPAVAGSSIVPSQPWPAHKPIEITFSKPMDHQSVLDNLLVHPAGESARLPISWRGNTLVIGADADRVEPLAPDTDYMVAVLPDAKDKWGNRLGEAWVMRFHTAPTQQVTGPPTPTPTEPRPTDTPTQQVAQTGNTPTVDQPPTPAPPTSTPNPTPTPGQTRTVGTARTSTPTPVPATATPTQPNTPTASPTPSQHGGSATPPSAPEATPTPDRKSTPDANGTPTPNATPPATPEPQATPSPATAAASGTPTPVPVTGAFGSVYWANPSVQERLGAPQPAKSPGQPAEYTFVAEVLGFQRGTMYARHDESKIYILFPDGTWSAVADTWTEADGNFGGPGPADNLWIPPQRFGKVWTELQLQDTLGYAVSQTVTPSEGRAQDFEHGRMLYSDEGFVYVLYTDPTQEWEIYPDASGHGTLITPTPEPGAATPAPSATPTSDATEPTDATPTSNGAETPVATETATSQPTATDQPTEEPTVTPTP